MKTSYRAFSVFFLLFSLSILFVSCSQESAITSPNESKVTPMAKTTVVPTSSINHSTDTIITFPKSGKTLLVSKNYSADQLSQIDNFLTTHTIKTKAATISPQLQSCSDRTFTNWVIGFASVSGKHIGIWDEARPGNWSSYYNDWGFNQIIISYPSEFSTANNNNTMFKPDSILVNMDRNQNYQTIAQSFYAYGVHRFNFDEPFTSLQYPALTVSQLVTYTNWIYNNIPGSKVAFTDWELNTNPFFSWYLSAIQQTYNSYMMCDQYQNSQEYMWQNYPNWYGQTRANVGGNLVDYNYDRQYGYVPFFIDANNLGMNQIWLYADDPANPGDGMHTLLMQHGSMDGLENIKKK